MKTANLDLLEKSQLPPPQARAIPGVMDLEIASLESTLATKRDLEGTARELRSELKDFEHRLELKMAQLEARLMRWIFTCMLGQTAVIAGAVYFAITHLRP